MYLVCGSKGREPQGIQGPAASSTKLHSPNHREEAGRTASAMHLNGPRHVQHFHLQAEAVGQSHFDLSCFSPYASLTIAVVLENWV